MAITATFSNGSTDTYKGKRAVKAAWAIIRKSDGKLLSSGHSLDRAKASKTAEGNLRYVIGAALGRPSKGISDRPDRIAHRNAYFNKLARELGFADWKAAYAAYQADAAEARRNVNVEILDL